MALEFRNSIKVYVVWVELFDGTRRIQAAFRSKEDADRMVKNSRYGQTASCGCCEDPAPITVLGIDKIWTEELTAR